MAATSLSPSRRAWQRFKRNRLGFWSLVLFCALVVMSLFAELLSNDRPLVVRYEGKTYFPLVQDLPETVFGGDFEAPTDYLDPFIREQITRGDNWAVYAPNPYGPKTLNYFAKSPNPSAPSADNWLGTDDRGRDLLAQLIYGFRISVLFALALTAIGTVLGIVTGAIQGYFGGRTDAFIMRAVDIQLGFPSILVALILLSVLGKGVDKIIIGENSDGSGTGVLPFLPLDQLRRPDAGSTGAAASTTTTTAGGVN